MDLAAIETKNIYFFGGKGSPSGLQRPTCIYHPVVVLRVGGAGQGRHEPVPGRGGLHGVEPGSHDGGAEVDLRRQLPARVAPRPRRREREMPRGRRRRRRDDGVLGAEHHAVLRHGQLDSSGC